METAQGYMLDARGLLQTLEINDPKARFQVPRFEVCAVIDERAHQQCVDDMSLDFKSIYQCAEDFISVLSLSNHRLEKSIRFIIQKAVLFQPKKSSSERLFSFLDERLPSRDAEEVKRMMSEICQQYEIRIRQLRNGDAMNEEEENEERHQTASAFDSSEDFQGKNDLTWRKHLRKMNGMEKLQTLELKEPTIPNFTSTYLTNSARIWTVTCMLPILACLRTHFDNDKEAFLQRWPLKKNFTKFSRFCCRGSPQNPCNAQ